jgi:hypothetical protein
MAFFRDERKLGILLIALGVVLLVVAVYAAMR